GRPIPFRACPTFALSPRSGGTRRSMLTRRATLLSTISALRVWPTDSSSRGLHPAVLSEESLAIARDLVAKGRYRSVQEVVTAAVEAMMVRDGWGRYGQHDEHAGVGRTGAVNRRTLLRIPSELISAAEVAQHLDKASAVTRRINLGHADDALLESEP